MTINTKISKTDNVLAEENFVAGKSEESDLTKQSIASTRDRMESPYLRSLEADNDQAESQNQAEVAWYKYHQDHIENPPSSQYQIAVAEGHAESRISVQKQRFLEINHSSVTSIVVPAATPSLEPAVKQGILHIFKHVDRARL